MMTLREAPDLVPDFRSSQGRRHSLGPIRPWQIISHHGWAPTRC